MNYLTALRRFNLNVNLFLLSAAIIGLTNFGGIFAAILNLYLLRLGYTAQFIGTLNFIGSLALLITCLPASALERYFGSRKLIIIGLAVNSISSIAIQAAVFIPASWRSVYILMSYALNSIGLALYLVNSQPFLAAATSSLERGYAFSIQAALWPLSGFIGSLLGGFFPGLISRLAAIPLTGPGPYQLTLWISAIVSVFAMLIMLLTNQPANDTLTEKKPDSLLNLQKDFQSPIFKGFSPSKVIAVLSIVVAVQIMGEGSIRAFMNVYLDNALTLPTSMVGGILGVGQFVAGLGALCTPFFTNRLGNASTYIIFSIAISFCMVPLIFIPSWIGAGLGFMTAIMMVQIARPALITIQMESVPIHYRASMSAITTMAASLSMGVIGLIGGFMIPNYGYPSFFLFSAWMTGLSAICFWLYIKLPRGVKDR